MPQMLLPVFPDGVVYLTPELAVMKEGGQVTYFNGMMPVFSHGEKEVNTFQMITSQFCCAGVVKQADIARVFGVTLISVKRSVKRYRALGAAGFYAKKKTRGAGVLLPDVVKRAQDLLDDGQGVPEVAERLGLKRDTLAKAVRDGRLHRDKKKDSSDTVHLSTKSERSVEDNAAEIGMGATDTVGRVAASKGLSGPPDPAFKPSSDVPNAGALLSLPALLAVGLLRGTEEKFKLPRGYYRLTSIFLLLAFMALARLKSIERLRYCAPGELGKMLGLDRIPEVRTLRRKVSALSQGDTPTQWGAELCGYWMAAAPDEATAFYVDGHVRVYHGEKAVLPRHYVARQKLCLRATVEYWVNAMDGKPFFFVHKDIDPKLIKVLEQDIVPRLIREVPHQPRPEALEADKLLHRFTVIFDREGYSPDLLRRLKKLRVACLTYHKHPGNDWPLADFRPHQVKLVSGEIVEMKLAERMVSLKNKLSVREIRRLTESGHQTSILSTDYKSEVPRLAAAMFARWSQENFFRYMRQHFDLDRLVEYDVEAIPDPKTRVVNPEHRRLETEIRKTHGVLNRSLATIASLKAPSEPGPSVDAFAEKRAALDEEAAYLRETLDKLKNDRKQTPRHITLDQLPEGQRFTRHSTQTKHLLDTIKMVAYRAETAMVHVLREKLARAEDARTLLRAIYSAEADLVPDLEGKTLTVRLHHLANRSSDDAVRHLCQELNATETKFPDSDLTMVYELVS